MLAFARKSLVVVDEAFIDFVENESIKALVRQNPYLLVLRSLTKYYALPGLRLGYLHRRNAPNRAARRLSGAMVRQRPGSERGAGVSQGRAVHDPDRPLAGKGAGVYIETLDGARRISSYAVANQFFARQDRQAQWSTRCSSARFSWARKYSSAPAIPLPDSAARIFASRCDGEETTAGCSRH